MSTARPQSSPAVDDGDRAEEYVVAIEQATRSLLEMNVAVIEDMERTAGLVPIRALQTLARRGPSLVSELGEDLNVPPSTASRLGNRQTEAGLTTRHATRLELTDTGLAVFEELVALRRRALHAVTELMDHDDRAALLRGAHAFTAAQAQLVDRGRR